MAIFVLSIEAPNCENTEELVALLKSVIQVETEAADDSPLEKTKILSISKKHYTKITWH